MKSSFTAGAGVCTGPSTVDTFALGRELLCGDCAELESGGVGGVSVEPRGIIGESMKS